MTSNVWVSVCGVHETDGESAPVRTVSPGSYIFEDGQHEIRYEESADGAECVPVRMTVSRPFMIRDRSVRRVDLVKNGTRMRFVPGRRQKVNYRTPYGVIAMETQTHEIAVKERGDFLCVQIRYDLEMAGQRVSTCTLTAEITPRPAQ